MEEDYNASHTNFRGRSEAVLAVTITFATLMTLFVFFRMVSRLGVVKKLYFDDYFMLLAWLLAFGLSFAICFGTAYGLGRHERYVPLNWQPALKKANYVFSVLYNPALMATKTSILAFYLTLSKTNRTFRWATIGTLFIVNAGGIALTMLTIFQCRPVGAVFMSPIPETANCTDIVTIYLSSAPLNIITDCMILFLPMPILTGMRLPKKQKIILVITFGFGIFVAVVDVVRIVYLQSASMTRLAEIQANASEGTSSSGTDSRNAELNDFTWYASLSFMWSGVEVNVGVMCACVPALKPLVSRFLPGILRDDGDFTEKESSVSDRNMTAEMARAQRIPSVQDSLEHRSPSSNVGAQDDGPMGMMDFLTTPEQHEATDVSQAELERTQTALTNSSRATVPQTPNFFDFVNMKGSKSMVHMTNKESIFPITMVTVLFFIWGFEYGLLDVLNQQFQRVASMSPAQTTGIHSAYFAGYFVGPLCFGRFILKHWGFSKCYSVGLAIYACGTLVFWPAAVLTSFPAFIITNFMVGIGLSILETAANPFIALCGPQKYGEIRLNFSQGVQAIGSVVAPLIANRAFFHRSFNAPSLVDTQWAYLGISLFTALLAVVYYYIPLPEATDIELEDASERMDGANKAHMKLSFPGKSETPTKIPIIYLTLGLGVFSQFCYVGAQEVNATTFDTYLALIAPRLSVSNFMAIAHTAFAVSRFLAAGLGFFIKPRVLLFFFYTGAIVFSALCMARGPGSGDSGVVMITMVFFFEGPLFSLIFAQSLRGMGRHTKTASALITAAISGGAVFPPISTAIAHGSIRDANFSHVAAVAAFAGGIVYALVLNGYGKARLVVDPVEPTDAAGSGDEPGEEDDRPGSLSSRASRALSFLSMNKKYLRRDSGGLGQGGMRVECRERVDGSVGGELPGMRLG
ncbi:hypothetical protein MBLNU230_g5649t1 [Neophaeotheca triangularis]